MSEEKLSRQTKHQPKKVLRDSYLAKVPTVNNTVWAAGFGNNIPAGLFHYQLHYTQGRQLLTTDQIKQLCPAEIWQFIDSNVFPGLDNAMAAVEERGIKDLTPDEDDFRAQVRLCWFYRETIRQDASFLWPLFHDSRLFRDIKWFQDPYSPFMDWFQTVLTPAATLLQQQADRVHSAIARQVTDTVMDEARDLLGPPVTSADSRQLLSKMVEILDAQQLGKPAPQPQPAVPVAVKPQYMEGIPKDLTQARVGLMPLWAYWSRKLRHFYLPSYSIPPLPPQQELKWRDADRDGKNEKLQMLLELDRQVEVAWRAAKLKDDDRKHAAAMVVSAWENKMRTYAHVRADGQHAVGISVNQVGTAFRKAKKQGPQAVIFVKKAGNAATNVTSTVQAFMDYFGA